MDKLAGASVCTIALVWTIVCTAQIVLHPSLQRQLFLLSSDPPKNGPEFMLVLKVLGGGYERKRYTPEKVIGMFREAEVELSRRQKMVAGHLTEIKHSVQPRSYLQIVPTDLCKKLGLIIF